MEKFSELLQKLDIELSMTERAARLAEYWAAHVAVDGLGDAILTEMEERKAEIVRGLAEASWRGVKAYRDFADPATRDATIGHVTDHVSAIINVASGRFRQFGEDPMEFVRAHAVMRARQGFPLMALLHAYRFGHRGTLMVLQHLQNKYAKTEAESLRAARAIAEFTIEYTDMISVTLTETYTNEERMLVEQRARARFALLDDLLNGRNQGRAEMVAALKAYGIGEGRSLQALVARPEAEENSDGLRFAVAKIERCLKKQAVPGLVEIMQGKVIALIADQRQRGESCLDELRRELTPAPVNGDAPPNLRVGLSNRVSSLAAIPAAYEQALQALAFTSPARPFIALQDVPLREYLIANAGVTANHVRPRWLDAYAELSTNTRGTLTATLQAYADANLNASQAAASLGVHVNTVYFRLNKVSELVGQDVRDFRSLSDALLVLEFDRHAA